MDARNRAGGGPVGAERKLVAVLVCQVDQPTSAAGHHDLESADQLLAGRLNRVQAEVARHGGLVTEVMGDTVVAVFGVPRTRDDDAERAVRTALAIRAAMATSGVAGGQLRAAVACGETLVSVGVPDGQGWGISGEVVAAAMAVKDAAPPGVVLVTAAALQATERTISYAPARELRLAAAAGPVPVWDALAPRPRSGRTPPPVLGVALVGRDGELAVLLDRYQRTRTGGGPQLVTLLGPAGIGKSRLLAELGQQLAGESAPPAWRTSRAHSHVDGASFGALVELAKAEAKILESDHAATAARKLTAAIARLLPDPTAAAWVARQLGPLVSGSAAADAASGRGVERAEDVATAWRWLLRALADQQPLVLAVEDLHWADHLLLDVLEGVADPARVGPAPLLVVVTARPELLARRPDWDQEHPNRTTVRLEALAAVDTTRLLQALLDHHRVAATIDPDLLARVGGNPLFAEEYARLLRDRRGRAGTLPLPASIHAVIGARLDAMAPRSRYLPAIDAICAPSGSRSLTWLGCRRERTRPPPRQGRQAGDRGPGDRLERTRQRASRAGSGQCLPAGATHDDR
jgi:class 3 adenylate cyclase